MSKSKGIIESLLEKPWEKDQIEIDNEHQGQTLNLSKYKVGLRTIMVVSTVIFSLFIEEVIKLHNGNGSDIDFTTTESYWTYVSLDLKIQNILGKTIITTTKETDKKVIDVSNLSVGIYIVKLGKES